LRQVVEASPGRFATVGFAENNALGPGLISGGTFLLDRLRVAAQLPLGVSSFEQDFLARRLQDIKFMGFVSSGYFIAIEFPESFARAQTELSLVAAVPTGPA
jgi:NDP-sugar pyrophosphorylase family protein